MKLTRRDTLELRRPNKIGRYVVKNIEFWLLCLPAIVFFLVFHYWPMFGAIIAFKDFNYSLGILGSKWVGLDNFKFFFMSQDAWRITRNAVGYSLINMTVGTGLYIAVALMLFEITSRKCVKFYQTVMIFPHFMSWVIVGYITHILFSSEFGVLNQIITFFGGESVAWYSTPGVWPFILPITGVWKNVGMSCIMYYAALMGVDGTLYEAATIDGASRWRQTIHISLPALLPMVTILTILSVGTMFYSDFGLYYQIPRDIGVLYPTTDVIDTYVYRGLRTGDMSISSAVGLFQSLVGFLLVILTNAIVKKIEPDNAMF